jgi:hypothetical protein
MLDLLLPLQLFEDLLLRQHEYFLEHLHIVLPALPARLLHEHRLLLFLAVSAFVLEVLSDVVLHGW